MPTVTVSFAPAITNEPDLTDPMNVLFRDDRGGRYRLAFRKCCGCMHIGQLRRQAGRADRVHLRLRRSPVCDGVRRTCDRDISMKPSHTCCAPWEAAKQHGTDSEGFSALISADDLDNTGLIRIGCDLPPVSFCPWCGSMIIPNLVCGGKVVGTSA